MQRLQSGMDGTLSRSDLGEDEKAKQFLQLQNRYLTFKQQLNAYTPLPARNKPEEVNTSQPEVNVPTAPTPAQEQLQIIPATPVQAPTRVTAPQALSTMATSSSSSSPSLPPSILTPPPTVESLSPVRKRKRPQSVKFVN